MLWGRRGRDPRFSATHFIFLDAILSLYDPFCLQLQNSTKILLHIIILPLKLLCTLYIQPRPVTRHFSVSIQPLTPCLHIGNSESTELYCTREKGHFKKQKQNPTTNLLDGFFEKFLENSVLVNAGLIQTLNIDELDPDHPLQGVAAQRRQLPVAVFDDPASVNRDERRPHRRRFGVGQPQRNFLGGNFPPEQDDAVVVRNDVRHLLDQKDGRFSGNIFIRT